MGISSMGVGSGLDIQGLINGLMTSERSKFFLKTLKRTEYNDRISRYATIKTDLDALSKLGGEIKSLSSGIYKFANSDQTVASGGMSSNYVGDYVINVTQLSSKQSTKSKGFALNNSATPGGNTDPASISLANNSGKNSTLTIAVGSLSDDGTTFNQTGSVQLTFTPGEQTLGQIRDKVNAAGIGVTASIVDNGDGSYSLKFDGDGDGASSAFRITATDGRETASGPLNPTQGPDTANGTKDTNSTAVGGFEAGLSTLIFDPTTPVSANESDATNQTQLSRAQNAKADVNGTLLSNTTNNFDGMFGAGFNFTALKVGTTTFTGTAGTVDNAALKTKIEDFVKAYNKAVGSLKANQEKGVSVNKEQTPFRIEYAIRTILNDGADGKAITDFGVSIDKEGIMSFDGTKFDAAIASDAGSAARFFGETNGGVPGVLTNLSTYIDDTVNSSEGILTLRNQSLKNAINRINDEESRFETRLGKLQDRYFKMFTRLDSTLSSLQQSSNYLTQQLASISQQFGGFY